MSALPLIGLTKTWRDDTDVYITPTPAEAEQLAGLGCAMVAFDATRRPRPHSVPELIGAIQAAGALALADVATPGGSGRGLARGGRSGEHGPVGLYPRQPAAGGSRFRADAGTARRRHPLPWPKGA
ncbi:hypothetical protein [Deinococcus sp. LM3]|uniref:hypothetical protein n=1 Tax=Deinococcus sp. LM3 TaxID=1938608 RepID=UPI003204C84F